MQETKHLSTYKEGLRSQILHVAMKAFAAQGIRAVKMDDVAQALGISKRTLYEIYDNKELLLMEGIKQFNQLREAQMTADAAECSNVMEIMLRVYQRKVEEFRQTNSQFYADLAKYPKVLDYLNEENRRVKSKFLGFMERGVREGFFRDDVNYELGGMLFDMQGRFIMEQQLYRQYSIEEIFHSLVFVSLRGLCTDKGVRALEQIK